MILIVGILMLSLTSAVECWGEAEINTEIQLIQKCPSCSFVNLTSISYPNGTIFLNEEMTQNGINFNYTLPDSSQTGKLSYGVIGDKNGISPPEEQTLCIELSPTGRTIEKPEASFYFAMLFFIFLLFVFFLIIAIKSPYENKKEMTREGEAVTGITVSKYVKLISAWISFGLFLWLITIISGMANNYIFFEGLKNMISNLLRFLNILAVGVNWGMSLFLFWIIWKDIILNKKIIKNGKALLKEL